LHDFEKIKIGQVEQADKIHGKSIEAVEQPTKGNKRNENVWGENRWGRGLKRNITHVRKPTWKPGPKSNQKKKDLDKRHVKEAAGISRKRKKARGPSGRTAQKGR